MNLLVGTPGRLLQHMDETPYFDCSHLVLLVLDEADRLLDMGFAAALDAIIEFLPRTRQTLLFSATQTRKVSDLARLSLRDAEYISVHENAAAATPPRLLQLVTMVPLERKLHCLWAFLKTHLGCKTLVFASSCRQVSFLHDALRQLRPGVPLRALHGRMKQPRRMSAFYDFCAAPAMVLLATDVAARGLDFPAVDWVFQLDCPEDVAAYIHRVGRTARYTAAGKALLLLDPSEAAFKPLLAAARVPFTEQAVNVGRVPPVAPALAGLLSADAQLKASAQRCVTTYLRSVHVQPNKAVFDVTRLDAAAFAASLGLTGAPKLRFLRRERAPGAGAGAEEGEEEGEGEEEEEEEEAEAAAPAEDFLALKRANHSLARAAEDEPAAGWAQAAGLQPPPKKPARLRIAAGGVARAARGAKLVFDSNGAPRLPLQALADEGAGEEEAPAAAEGDLAAAVAARYAQAAAARTAGDETDKRRERALRRERKLTRKRKLRARAAGVAGGAELGGADSDSEEGDGDGEEEPQREAPPKRSRLEPAHAGMARRGGEEESLEALEAAALARLARSRA